MRLTLLDQLFHIGHLLQVFTETEIVALWEIWPLEFKASSELSPQHWQSSCNKASESLSTRLLVKSTSTIKAKEQITSVTPNSLDEVLCDLLPSRKRITHETSEPGVVICCPTSPTSKMQLQMDNHRALLLDADAIG
ncbi:hypothetical protein Aperf_G00000033364 [Anoplocephala perfoliata]